MQRELVFREDKRGGRRDGAGRPVTGKRRDPRHRTRPEISRHEPQHVTIRVVDAVGRLRRMDMYRAIHRAMRTALRRPDFHCVHASIQGNHLHFIVEADNRRALTLGMQGLKISMACWINAALEKRGLPRLRKVFAYRYHVTPLRSPRQVRHALAYVLNNWRRHGEDRRSNAALDPFSTAVLFRGWKNRTFDIPSSYDPLPVVSPQTWLLRIGWQKHGPIPIDFVPGTV
jgi:putative transposase